MSPTLRSHAGGQTPVISARTSIWTSIQIGANDVETQLVVPIARSGLITGLQVWNDGIDLHEFHVYVASGLGSGFENSTTHGWRLVIPANGGHGFFNFFQCERRIPPDWGVFAYRHEGTGRTGINLAYFYDSTVFPDP